MPSWPALEVNPKVSFTVSFIGSWFDPPKAKEAAFAMIDKGVDVLYAERFGVSDAARSAACWRSATSSTPSRNTLTPWSPRLWAHGADGERGDRRRARGKFVAEDYGKYSTQRFGGASLAPLGTFEKKIPAALMAKVKARRRPFSKAASSSRWSKPSQSRIDGERRPGPARVAAHGHLQALRQPRRQRRYRPRAGAGRGARAAGRERGRQRVPW